MCQIVKQDRWVDWLAEHLERTFAFTPCEAYGKDSELGLTQGCPGSELAQRVYHWLTSTPEVVSDYSKEEAQGRVVRLDNDRVDLLGVHVCQPIWHHSQEKQARLVEIDFRFIISQQSQCQ